jgi:hypothetical protein
MNALIQVPRGCSGTHPVGRAFYMRERLAKFAQIGYTWRLFRPCRPCLSGLTYIILKDNRHEHRA